MWPENSISRLEIEPRTLDNAKPAAGHIGGGRGGGAEGWGGEGGKGEGEEGEGGGGGRGGGGKILEMCAPWLWLHHCGD